MITLGSLYSGAIDAFGYAGLQLGMETLWQVENNPDAHKYLKKNYPNAKRYYYDGHCGSHNLEWVNIITGGDPCQPSSVAGVGLGQLDARYRWPEMFRICSEMQPDWIINENVTGTIGNLVFDQKITDLENIGYSWQAYSIPAVATGLHHRRQRVFIVAAHPNVQRWGELLCANAQSIFKESKQTAPLGTQCNAFLQFEESEGEPALFAVANEIPDQVFRLGAAGNSIVSTIPIILLEAIKEIYRLKNDVTETHGRVS